MLDAVTKRTQELAKPKKGQKTSPGVTDAVSALKAAQGDLTSATAGLVSMLEDYEETDKALNTNSCPVSDVSADCHPLRRGADPAQDEFKAKIAKEVLEARTIAISNAKRLLGGSTKK